MILKVFLRFFWKLALAQVSYDASSSKSSDFTKMFQKSGAMAQNTSLCNLMYVKTVVKCHCSWLWSILLCTILVRRYSLMIIYDRLVL